MPVEPHVHVVRVQDAEQGHPARSAVGALDAQVIGGGCERRASKGRHFPYISPIKYG